jgi:hypothetical protein
MKHLLACILSLLWVLPGVSQNLSTLREIRESVGKDTILLGELWISPSSVMVFSGENPVDSSTWHFNSNAVIWKKKPEVDSVIVRYRVLPQSLVSRAFNRSPAMMYRESHTDYIGTLYASQKDESLFLPNSGLDYNGSFSRGVSFGNRQNLTVNSNLNLQLNGSLGDGIELVAALSDNNLPIQPQGNTSQLQEFDRVFIQIKRNNGQLTAGDYELSHSSGHFMRYYKRLQGATAQDEFSLPDDGQIRVKAGMAVSRGRFSRNSFVGSEGNQGPYRLVGADGESFIIVLAGTEKVYVDGRLMKRGQEYDYIIDYNRGTVVFTSNRLITKDIRIIVEFEYATRQYLRTLHTVNAAYERGVMSFYINGYSEQDGKFSGGARTLTPGQLSALAEAGDAAEGVLAPGQRPGVAANDPVRYIKVPAPPESLCFTDSIYVQAGQENGGIWAVTFTEVGEGNGHYRRLPAEAFGTAFEWVPAGPDCQPQGDYEPVVKLMPPGQQQLYAAGLNLQWNQYSALQAEVAMSRTDLNRFSNADDDDNTGLAVFLTGKHRIDIGSSPWSINGGMNYEGVRKQFKGLNPWREAEFSRDWNLEPASTPEEEHLGDVSLSLVHAEHGALQYKSSGFARDSLFSGVKHRASLNWNQSGWELAASGNWLKTQSRGARSTFSRPQFQLTKNLNQSGSLRAGMYVEQEVNQRYDTSSDSINASSFRYEMARWFARLQESEAFTWAAEYAVRIDYAPIAGKFVNTATAHNYSLSGEWRQRSGSQLKWNLAYRRLEGGDTSSFQNSPSQTLLGRIEHRITMLRGFIRSSVLYDISSGQEQKVEFIYRPVQPGEQGTHLWEDRNGDGQIQFDEIELPPFPGAANVIRITQYTEDFIRTENSKINALLRLDPSALIRETDGLEGFLRKWSAQMTMGIDKKTRPGFGVRTWDPLQLAIPDSSLIALTSTLRADLFLNRGNASFDMQFSWVDMRNRLVLTSGYDSRRQTEQSVRLRTALAPGWIAIGKVSALLQENDSEFFSARDYLIRSIHCQPEIQWQPAATFRTSIAFIAKYGKNTLQQEFGESARQYELRLGATVNQTAKTSISASVGLVQVQYQGLPNTPVSFALMNGLQNGRNYLWNLQIDRRLDNNVQLNVTYEGRQTGLAPLIHIGRVEVRAAF